MKISSLIGLTIISMSLQSCSGDMNSDDQVTLPKNRSKPTIIIDKDAARFAMVAASSCLNEIEMGKLAVKKGVDKRVKNFGAMMAKDHAKANAKLEAIASSKKISLPDTITPDEQIAINKLNKNQGRDFDRAYLADMVKDHENDIKVFNEASKQLMDPELRAFAAKNVLILKRHLDAINMIRGSMK